MTMHKDLDLKDDSDRFYEARKEDTRRLSSIENYADVSMQGIEGCIKKYSNQ